MNNSQRLNDIRACARSIKLRIPFEKQYDNVFDMLDGIMQLCTDALEEEITISPDCTTTVTMLDPGIFEVTQYMLDGQWLSVGIPKHQAYTEQVEWCIRKKATRMKFRAKGTEEIKEQDLTTFFSPTQKIIK